MGMARITGCMSCEDAASWGCRETWSSHSPQPSTLVFSISITLSYFTLQFENIITNFSVVALHTPHYSDLCSCYFHEKIPLAFSPFQFRTSHLFLTSGPQFRIATMVPSVSTMVGKKWSSTEAHCNTW
jgi:hypothetical protein